MLDRAEAYGLDLMFPAGDTAIGASLREHGEFSRVELDFLVDHASADRGVLLDVGANIGSVGLPFARQRPGWRVKAVEAHRGLATILAANTLSNDLSNVEVHHAAAGHTRGLLDFPTPALDAARNFGEVGYHMREQEPVEGVRLLTLDEMATADTLLVKIDVEGMEPQVLEGARGLLAARKATWVCEAGASRQPTIAAFLAAGYAVHWFYVPFVTLAPARGGAPPNPHIGDTNIVAVPPGAPLKWDLRRVTAADEARPGEAAAYPYLARYGLT